MAFRIEESDGSAVVHLSGWDRLMTWRGRVVFPNEAIVSATLARRGDLEPFIDHRLAGIGTHDGGRRPGRRRVGPMLGRHIVGKQFWAVGRGGPDRVLVVLDLSDHEFVRAVLDVADPHSFRQG